MQVWLGLALHDLQELLRHSLEHAALDPALARAVEEETARVSSQENQLRLTPSYDGSRTPRSAQGSPRDASVPEDGASVWRLSAAQLMLSDGARQAELPTLIAIVTDSTHATLEAFAGLCARLSAGAHA